MSLRTTGATDQRPVSERIVSAVATLENTVETDLDPLYRTIDAETIGALFRHGATGVVEFTYHGHAVVVSADGSVIVDGVYA